MIKVETRKNEFYWDGPARSWMLSERYISIVTVVVLFNFKM